MPLEVVDSAGPTGIVWAREFERRACRSRACRMRLAITARLQDAQNLFRVGRGSNADVLAAAATVAAAQLAIDQATEMVGVAEEQLRLATQASSSEPVSVGEDATGAMPRDAYDIVALQRETAANRPEIESSTAQARSADKAYSARRDLFRFGKGTSVELADAEANLFQARLAAVSARIDQRTARVRIDHATDRDVVRGMS